MRAKSPGCFFVGAVERAAVHPGGHAVELLPYLRVCGVDDVNDDDDDDVIMVIMLTRMTMMLSSSPTLEPVARHRESDLVKEWQERPAEL